VLESIVLIVVLQVGGGCDCSAAIDPVKPSGYIQSQKNNFVAIK
jgi:hypothetical protein